MRAEKKKNLEFSDRLVLSYDVYKTKQNNNGETIYEYNKNILNPQKTRHIRIPLKNIGKSSIVELYLVVYDRWKKSLVEYSKLEEYVKNGWVNSVIGYYNTILPEECISLDVYYREKSKIFEYGLSEITIYYKDGYGNYYWQLLFLDTENVEEPHKISRDMYLEKTTYCNKRLNS